MGSSLKKLRPGPALRTTHESSGSGTSPGQLEKKGEAEHDGVRNTAAETVEGADLFVATGAQYMSDACKDDALRVLDRLEAASRLGIPTAMVGQGLGPFEDLELRQRVQAVLPSVNLIFIRDRQTAPRLLDSLGADPSHVIFTGDDAIELAFSARREGFGTAIGVSLRVAQYTRIDSRHIEAIRPALHQAVAKYRAGLIAIPISHSLNELDDRVLRQLLAEQVHVQAGGWRFETPLEIIRKIGGCRLVVTGAFHTAVFALAQGIPAIGLAKSTMYVDKFNSLVDQFGSGCQVIYLDAQDLSERLTSAIDGAWESAEQVRPGLLEAAARQIELGRAAYGQLFKLVESSKRNHAMEMTVNEFA
jgi:colanic acid/amylovoran biosynthesis protein